LSETWVTLARITRARGIRGEVTAVPLAVSLDRFEGLSHVWIRDSAGALRQLPLERVWEHQGQLIFKFRGVEDRTSAETLERSEICVPESERAQLEPGEYYYSDLEGCRVEDESGRAIGAVKQVLPTGGVDVLELDSGMMIPLSRAICTTIDIEGRRIVASLPEGLEELNR
jgi:16S rRNA processing protein RimM